MSYWVKWCYHYMCCMVIISGYYQQNRIDPDTQISKPALSLPTIQSKCWLMLMSVQGCIYHINLLNHGFSQCSFQASGSSPRDLMQLSIMAWNACTYINQKHLMCNSFKTWQVRRRPGVYFLCRNNVKKNLTLSEQI